VTVPLKSKDQLKGSSKNLVKQAKHADQLYKAGEELGLVFIVDSDTFPA